MDGSLVRPGRLATAALVATGVIGACSTPEDPAIPPLDADAGVDASDAGAVVTSCVGAPNGASCGAGKICVSDACLDPACGDAVTTPPEECDRGSGNAPGSGCEANCRYSCTPGDAARGCPSADPCLAPASCDPGQRRCVAGSPL